MGALCQDDGNYFHRFRIQDRTAGTACIQPGLLLYAGSFKLDIFGSDSIKISAAMLPRDKCCTKITVAADLVPKVQYILRASANTPKRCTLLSGHDCTGRQRAGWILCESNCFSPCPLPSLKFASFFRVSRVLPFAALNRSKIAPFSTMQPLILSSLDNYSIRG